jgi:hypothetical protein
MASFFNKILPFSSKTWSKTNKLIEEKDTRVEEEDEFFAVELTDESGSSYSNQINCEVPPIPPKPPKLSFYEEISFLVHNRTSDREWGFINNIRQTYDGVRFDISVNPDYLFKQPLLTKVGVLVIGEYRSKISNITASFNVERSDSSNYFDDNYFDDGKFSRSKDWRYDRTNSFSGNGLSISRQVYLNSSYPFVTETENNELTLSEQFVHINIPFKYNISIYEARQLDYKILSVIDDIKKCILKNFLEEINKTKLEIYRKKFYSDISIGLVTDTFQHVIDLSCDSKVCSSEEKDPPYIYLFIPIKSSVDKVGGVGTVYNIDLDKKSIDIFYELMEGASRIKGEFDVFTKLGFTSDGIYLKILPKTIELLETIKTEEEDRREYEYFRERMNLRDRAIHVRNPYTNLSTWD